MGHKEPAPWIRRLNRFLEWNELEPHYDESLWDCARRMNQAEITVIDDIGEKTYKHLKEEICAMVKAWRNATNPPDIPSKVKKKPKRRSKGKKKKPSKGGDSFYSSWAWKKLRFEVLKYYGAECMLCGDTNHICVDHIYPRKKFPHLELEFSNMQVLCDSCNRGKSNDDFTDFRPKEDVDVFLDRLDQ